MAMVSDGNNMVIGKANDWPVIKQYIREFGWMNKVKTNWSYTCPATGQYEEFKTQQALWEWMREPENIDRCIQCILAELMKVDLG